MGTWCVFLVLFESNMFISFVGLWNLEGLWLFTYSQLYHQKSGCIQTKNHYLFINIMYSKKVFTIVAITKRIPLRGSDFRKMLPPFPSDYSFDSFYASCLDKVAGGIFFPWSRTTVPAFCEVQRENRLQFLSNWLLGFRSVGDVSVGDIFLARFRGI